MREQYDVAISYAGENREAARLLADALKQRDVTVFFDVHEKAELWGKNLYDHLSDVYRNQARYCIILVSKFYAQKAWTSHERKAIQARALNENAEYILPVRLDDSELPGLLDTTSYLRWPPENEQTITDAFVRKLGRAPRELTSSLLRAMDRGPHDENAALMLEQFVQLQQQAQERKQQPPPVPPPVLTDDRLPLPGYFVPGAVHSRFGGRLAEIQTEVAILNDSSATPRDKLELLVMTLLKNLDDQVSRELALAQRLGGSDKQVAQERLTHLITERAAAFDLLSGIKEKRYDEVARAAIQRINQ